jgi:hypothetical protein
MVTGVAFLHEKIAVAPLDLAAEGLSLAVTIGGIIALAQRGPRSPRSGIRRARQNRVW